MAAVVLFSGGMDSTIALFDTLHKARDKGEVGQVHAITFYYGQTHVREAHAANWLWRHILKTQYQQQMGTYRAIHLEFIMPKVGSLMGQVPIKQYEGEAGREDDPAFIPHRNLLFISIAAMWARKFKVNHIITGLRGGFPDCTPAFEAALEGALVQSDPSDPPLNVTSPVHLSRHHSLRLAANIPECWNALAHTWTCFEGGKQPCGRCLPCKKRAEGFASFGRPDPALVPRT